jgi:hypothetical protein
MELQNHLEGLQLPNIIIPTLYSTFSGKQQKPENTIQPGTESVMFSLKLYFISKIQEEKLITLLYKD